MTHADALQHFRRLCDLPPEVREAALAEFNPPLAAAVRRMLAADTEEELKIGEAASLLAHAVREVEADDAEARGQVPDHIGPFRPVERLGGGATSYVYLAWQAAPRRLIALKIVRRGVPPSVAARFYAEAQALADLRLPAAPQIYAVGTHEQRAWLAMERLEGAPAAAWAAGRDAREVVAMVAELSDAVQATHDAGMVHRDLKPEHVRVEPDGRPRLLDFGLTPTDGEGLGTPAYMPPGPGCDVDTYALGVILMELLHGGLPPGWTSDRRPPPLPDPELQAVVRRAVSVDGYATPAALAEDLRRTLRHEPVVALPPRLARSLRLALRRHRRGLRRLGAALLAATLLFGLAVAWRGHHLAEAARQHEARAEQLAAQLAIRLQELRADEKELEATALLDLMADTPDLAGSAALARLWLDEGLRHRRGDAARAALVAASEHPDVRLTALDHLAASFHKAALPASLARVAATLPDPRWREAADLWHRRVSDTGPLRGVLARLGAGTPTGWRASLVVPAMDDGTPVFAVLEPDGAALVERAADLPLRRATPLGPTVGPRPAWLVQDGEAALLTAEEGGLRLMSARAPYAAERFPPVPGLISHTLARTHPGPARLYVGTGNLHRHLSLLRPGLAPALVHPVAEGSDVNFVLGVDLTGDGLDELVAAFGPWMAYEVRAFTADGDGLRPLEPVVLGNVDRLAALTRSDGGREVVAGKVNRYGSPARFGEDAPFGRPAGLYLLRLEAERWAVSTFVPLPMDAPELRTSFDRLLVGDVDGDGREEIYAGLVVDQEVLTWIVDPDQPEWGALVAGVRPLAAVDVDGDGRDELIVGLPDLGEQTWVLGLGEARLPPLDRPSPDRVDLAPAAFGSDSAPLLAELGLFREATRHALALAEVAAADERRALLTWVARVVSGFGTPSEAAAAWRAVVEAGDPAAWRQVQEHAARAHDPRLLRAAAEALGEDPTARLGPAAPVLLHGDPRAWRVVAPEAVRRWGSAGPTLTVFASHGDVLGAELVPQGALFQVELLLELTSVEPYASVALTARHAGEEQVHVGLLGAAGGGRTGLHLRCGRGRESVIRELDALPSAPVRYTLSLAVDLDAGTLRCSVRDAAEVEVLQDTLAVTSGGPEGWSFVLQARSAPAPDLPRFSAARAELQLLRAEILGAAVRPPPDHPAQAWARGDVAAALAAWDLDSPALAAWARFELGDPAQPRFVPDTACCLAHRLSRLQPWGFGAALAARQSPAERLRFFAESVASDVAWPEDVRTRLLDVRLDGLIPGSDDERMLLIRRASAIDAAGHPAWARRELLALLALPVDRSPVARAQASYAATLLAQNLVRADDREGASSWVALALTLSPSPRSILNSLRRDPLLRDLPAVLAWGTESELSP